MSLRVIKSTSLYLGIILLFVEYTNIYREGEFYAEGGRNLRSHHSGGAKAQQNNKRYT